ncbi:hypothetical protein [Achromobacter sp. AGC39]
MTDQNNADRDLGSSSGGRAYIAEYFATQLRRHDFARYINSTLAGDFACVLAQHLSKLRADGGQAGAPMLPSDAPDALRDFKLTVIQDGFHKIGKPMIQQLAQAGALESLGFGKHRVTEYGEWLLSSSSVALASAPVAGEAQKPMVLLLETTPDGYALHRSFDFNEPPTGFPGLVRKTPLYAAPQASQAVRILFPTHLRKMWSGGEVQAWLDNHQGITPPTASAKGSLERYRDWRAEQAEADKDGVRSEGHQ